MCLPRVCVMSVPAPGLSNHRKTKELA
jgi:hypothetical protein